MIHNVAHRSVYLIYQGRPTSMLGRANTVFIPWTRCSSRFWTQRLDEVSRVDSMESMHRHPELAEYLSATASRSFQKRQFWVKLRGARGHQIIFNIFNVYSLQTLKTIGIPIFASICLALHEPLRRSDLIHRILNRRTPAEAIV